MTDPWEGKGNGVVDIPQPQSTPQKPVTNPFKKRSEVVGKKGLKIGIWGPTASGKTFFTFTSPAPIFTIDTELGSASVSCYFPEKEINIEEIFAIGNDDIWERDDVESFEKIKEGINYIYQNQGVAGTVVIDSGTDLWTLCQSYAKVKIFKIRPEDRLKYQFDWGKVNNIYLQLIAKLLAMSNHVILTGREKETYTSTGNPSGEMSPGWMKATEFMLDVVIQNKVIAKGGKQTYLSEIIKCRQAGSLQGKIYENLTFEKLQQEIKDNMPKGGEAK